MALLLWKCFLGKWSLEGFCGDTCLIWHFAFNFLLAMVVAVEIFVRKVAKRRILSKYVDFYEQYLKKNVL